MIPPSSLVIFQGWGVIDLPLRAAFSPAHPLARRDMPFSRARGFHDRALREQGESSGHPLRLSELTPSAERRSLLLALEP